MKNANKTIVEIVESWKHTGESHYSDAEILDWIKEKNQEITVDVKKIEFPKDNSGNWYYNRKKKGYVHKSGSFFRIVGAQWNRENELIEQPIIIQNEIGYLGIICKKINGVLHFLMQAKVEPGNENKVQISPTIQATRSNFMQVHGGKTPPYLDYFLASDKYEIIVDQIQSEQASRFYGKRNRNIIIRVEDDIDVLASHCWMTLAQIKRLMKIDNLVNMDTRTVISCIPFSMRNYTYKEHEYMRECMGDSPLFSSIFESNNEYIGINAVYHYMNSYKMMNRDILNMVNLDELDTWKLLDDKEWVCTSRKSDFKVVFCDISIDGREVSSWQQPLLESCGSAIYGLIYRKKENKYEFLVQCVSELGCFDKIELGPSVQIGYERQNSQENIVEKIFMERLYKPENSIVFDGLFSEEGGRFYHEKNRNVIMEISHGLEEIPPGYFWLDYYTLNVLIQFNNCLNIQLRNLLSILDL